MSDRGRFSGFRWHIEYHTTDKKKDKAADCVFLSEARICHNEKSQQYLAKCFIASCCPLRVKENELEAHLQKQAELAQEESAKNKKSKIIKISCSLPEKCVMYSKRFGKGKFIGFNEDTLIMSVQFEEKIIKFKYPDAIIEKHLIVPKYAFGRVMKDIRKAEKG